MTDSEKGPSGRLRRIAVGFSVIVLVILLFAGASYRRCLPLLMGSVFGQDGGMTFAIQGCEVSDQPLSAAIGQALELERNKRGLQRQTFLTCTKRENAPVVFPWTNNARWLPSYVCCAWQYRRHVVLAAPSVDQPGGTTAQTFEICLMPRWRYWKQILADCEKDSVWR